MTLYHLTYTWGEYEDATDIHIGTYSSREYRTEARIRFEKLIEEEKKIDRYGRRWPFGSDFFDGSLQEWESELDKDLEL